jgi:PTS system, lactose/cellobiose family IIC component
MSTEKKNVMDSIIGIVDQVSGPMTRFGQFPFVQAITRGMVASIGVTMIGSIFLIFNLLSSDGGLTANALIPFLRPYASQLSLVNSLSMNIMAIYMVVSIGAEYADVKGINKTTGAIGALFAFILLNYNAVAVTADGVNAFAINYWGGAGIITAILAGAISTNVIALCYEHNIRISLPDSVPPAIADSFSAIIPYFFTTIICWGLRTIMGVNVPQLVGEMLLPIFSAADNIFVFTLAHFLMSVLWICGLHGNNIVNAVTTPFTSAWLIENSAAFEAGRPIPYIWTQNLARLFMWVSSCWPILFYMFRSAKKLPHLKPLATICFPPAIFGIIEPMMFGLPIVLNPFLALPLVLSHTVTSALTYFLTSINFLGRIHINLPWATPAPILGYLSTGGSIGGFLVVIINFAVGMVIIYPFWKAYEKSELKRLEEEAEITTITT